MPYRLVGVGVALLSLFILAMCKAEARDDGRYANSPYKAWFDAQHNGVGQSCCLESDAHRYDGNYVLNADGSVVLSLNGKLHFLPAYMVLKGGNPTGSAIWWYMETGEYHTDYCFAPGVLG
jgi:hypothetical protein